MNRYDPSETVRMIPGIGPAAQANLEKLGITTLGDVLAWYPREYIDGSAVVPIAQAPEEKIIAIRGRVLKAQSRPLKQRHMVMVEVRIEDESGELDLRWFNQKFLLQKLVPGSEWIFIGMIKRFAGKRSMVGALLEQEARILPVYAQTEGITSKQFRSWSQWCLERVDLETGDLPAEVRAEHQLLSKGEALRRIHAPSSMDELDAARRYFSFAELFWYFVRTRAQGAVTHTEKAFPVPADAEYLKNMVGGLPFDLTDSQRRAVWDVALDMAKPEPMTRLLNGDVGSGKTVVAGLAAGLVARAGMQTVLLVPTELLARQHAETLEKLLPNLRVAVWTAARKDEAVKADVIVGTHAVLQETFDVPRLGLIVIDEQHRFGVRQRQLLRQRDGRQPHLLSMTATPIPRSLALILYADLPMSVLRDKPKDRLPIVTELITSQNRSLVHQRIMAELKKGNQVFVICPLIEEKKSDDPEAGPLLLFDDESTRSTDRRTVVAEVTRLRLEHPEYGRIEAVHGKMKPAEKRAVMDAMAAGDINVLVATSVIEVGIDVPRATVIVIEGAERFGLAQLHQFRGRVGRSHRQSYCFLMPEKMNQVTQQRLEALVEHQSGFEIAQKDLTLRGPGEMTGLAQSGLPDFRMANLTDLAFLQQVKESLDAYCRMHPGFLATVSSSTYSTPIGALE